MIRTAGTVRYVASDGSHAFAVVPTSVVPGGALYIPESYIATLSLARGMQIECSIEALKDGRLRARNVILAGAREE